MTSDDLPEVPSGARITQWSADTGPMPLDPRAAMILLMHVSWQRWHYYADLLRDQAEHPRGSDRSGGLIGHRIGMSKDGPYPAAEEIRQLARLEGEERDRCARLAKEAHAMGIEAY